MRSRNFLAIGGLFAGLGVALGAFAAHGLKSLLSPAMIEVFNTGVLYQMLHALAIIACALLVRLGGQRAEKYFFIAAICFIIGVLCFSGSLYALALTGMKWFGPITPLGGLSFILGWGSFVFAAIQINEENK
ncbi:DUF423 domain-containing protein [Vibrio sp.]|uniref:DUF423 domain-containing protein n=1 Tax=Vibrio sp. TaxID=678 RepID=UPI003D1065B3